MSYDDVLKARDEHGREQEQRTPAKPKAKRAEPTATARRADSLRLDLFKLDLETAAMIADLLASAEQRMRDARRGLPVSGMGGGSGSDGGSSPVERALGLHHEPKRDEKGKEIETGVKLDLDIGGSALTALTKLLAQNHRLIEQLYRLCSAWSPHKPNRKALEDTAKETGIMCDHCTRWMPPGWVEEKYRYSDAGGVLDDPMNLGRWCYDFARTNGRLPSESECRRRGKGQQVRVKVA